MLNNFLGGVLTIFYVQGVVTVANIGSSYLTRDGSTISDFVTSRTNQILGRDA